MEQNNYIEYQISNNLENMKMFPRLVEVLPQKDIEPVGVYVHEGEEFVYILEGILTYHYNGRIYDLYPGDTFHIRSNVPHNIINTTNNLVRLLVVSVSDDFSQILNDKNAFQHT
jgi:quercetin dioxygenase-like cupin family protein